jgi:ribose transport system permease protein/inositol transport system permease protein
MTANPAQKPRSGKSFLARYAIVIALVSLIVIISILVPRFLLPQNLFNVGMQVSINGILAVGMTCVILTGGIDLSIGSTLAVSGLIASLFAVAYPIENTFLATVASLVVALAAGFVCGLFNGIAVTKFKVTPFITTLANLSIIRGICYLLTDSRPIFGIADSYAWIGQGYIGPVPVALIILALTVVAAAIVLNRTPFGRHIYAVGGNDEVARLSGISSNRIKVYVYIISGVLAALGGYIYMSRLQSGQPTAGNGYELQAIAATVVGGTSLSGGLGNIWGTLAGALIIGILNNGMSLLQVSSYWQNVFTGIVILAAVAFNEYANSRDA